jgi:beta-phosphoglucomutase
MAIGTAAPPENANFVLDNLQLRPYFQGIFHSESVTKGKPDPEIFELAASSMGLKARDCLIFEDSVTGAEAAKRAGAQAVIVTTTHTQEEFSSYAHILRFITDYEGLRLRDLTAS